MWCQRCEERGDHYITIKVEVPRKGTLSEADLQKVTELRDANA